MIRSFRPRAGHSHRRRNTSALSAQHIERLECRQLLTAATTAEGFQQVAGDFDNDGNDDLLYWDAQTGNNTIALGSLARAEREFVTGSNYLDPTEVGNGWFTQIVAGDFDGNAYDDVFLWNSQTGQHVTYYNGLGTALSFSRSTNEIRPQLESAGAFDRLVSGDFDGDRRTDLFFFNTQTAQNRLASANGIYSGRRTFDVREVPDEVGRGHESVTAGDFDGDGRDDLFFWNPDTGGNRTYFAFGNHGHSQGQTFITPPNEQVSRHATGARRFTQVLAGDFDGDHRVDLLFWHHRTGWNHLVSANGSYDGQRRFHEEPRPTIDSSDLIDSQFEQMSAGDFDGDGRTDITFYRAVTGANQTYYAHGWYDGVRRFERTFHMVDPAEIDDDQRRVVPGPAPVDVTWNDGVLMLNGTNAANTIEIGSTRGGVYINGGNRIPPAYYQVHEIQVWLHGGNDRIDNLTDIPMVVRAGAGDDTIHGGNGVDAVSYEDAPGGVRVNLAVGSAEAGEHGKDTLRGVENVSGSPHDDVLRGDARNNTLRGGAGHDTINGGWGDDAIHGEDGNDTLTGGPDHRPVVHPLYGGHTDNDHIFGGALDDVLYGGYGNDRLNGETGRDHLNGGMGADTLHILSNDADTYIVDRFDKIIWERDPTEMTLTLTLDDDPTTQTDPVPEGYRITALVEVPTNCDPFDAIESWGLSPDGRRIIVNWDQALIAALLAEGVLEELCGLEVRFTVEIGRA